MLLERSPRTILSQGHRPESSRPTTASETGANGLACRNSHVLLILQALSGLAFKEKLLPFPDPQNPCPSARDPDRRCGRAAMSQPRARSSFRHGRATFAQNILYPFLLYLYSIILLVYSSP